MTQDLISRLTPNSSSTDDDDKDVRKLGYSLVGFLLLGVGGWMTIAPIDSAALAPAVVQVEGKRKAIQHLEGGIVSEIFVANGDLVTQGQILLSLDATRDKSELEILRGRLFNTRAKVDRLEAGEAASEKSLFLPIFKKPQQTTLERLVQFQVRALFLTSGLLTETER